MEAGYSPSPYSSPLKGEEIIPRLLRSARNDSKKGARNDVWGRLPQSKELFEPPI